VARAVALAAALGVAAGARRLRQVVVCRVETGGHHTAGMHHAGRTRACATVKFWVYKSFSSLPQGLSAFAPNHIPAAATGRPPAQCGFWLPFRARIVGL